MNDRTSIPELRRRLLGFVLRRVDDRQDAEDIVQEVLMRSWEKRDGLQDQAKIIPWLLQIARNVIADHYRSRSRVEEIQREQSGEPVDEAVETEASERDVAACLAPLMNRLPEDYREALHLAELDGLTQKEMVDVLDISYSGVKSRVQRARGLLAEEFLACCRVEFDSRKMPMGFKPRPDAAAENCHCNDDCSTG